MPLFMMEVRRTKCIGDEPEVVYRWFTRSAVLASMFTEVKGSTDLDGTVTYFAVKTWPSEERRPPVVTIEEDYVNEQLNRIRKERGWI